MVRAELMQCIDTSNNLYPQSVHTTIVHNCEAALPGDFLDSDVTKQSTSLTACHLLCLLCPSTSICVITADHLSAMSNRPRLSAHSPC